MSGRVNKFTGEYPQNYCFSYKQTRKKGLLLHKIRIFADKYLLGERIKTTYYFFCPRITRIFVQASAEPNDCVKPNEQNRVYSNFAMASNRTFKNLFGLCRAQPKMSRNRACSYCRAQPKISKKRSRKVRVYEPMSGQDKPVISDGFEVQTIHSQPV